MIYNYWKVKGRKSQNMQHEVDEPWQNGQWLRSMIIFYLKLGHSKQSNYPLH